MLTVATPALDDVQLEELVRSLVEPSVYFPVALNCCELPFAIVTVDGVTEIDLSDTPVPVKLADCGDVLALSLTLSVPERRPEIVGVNTTETVQVVPAPSVEGLIGQLLLCI